MWQLNNLCFRVWFCTKTTPVYDPFLHIPWSYALHLLDLHFPWFVQWKSIKSKSCDVMLRFWIIDIIIDIDITTEDSHEKYFYKIWIITRFYKIWITIIYISLDPRFFLIYWSTIIDQNPIMISLCLFVCLFVVVFFFFCSFEDVHWGNIKK